MKIKINQKAISITDEYEIFVENQLKYFVVSEPLKSVAKFTFLEIGSEKPILNVAKKHFGIRTNYLIQDLKTEAVYSFEEINNIKLIFKCEINDDLFQLFGHNSNRYSIFKNQNQVAYWEKNNLIFGESDFYEIISNDDENPLMLSAFCICIDNAKNNFQNEGSIFNLDIGFKGNLLQKFDENWEPNK